MSLSIVNNVASLNAQNNLGRTSAALSKRLELLSSGLKSARGGDVRSINQSAQVSSLSKALEANHKAIQDVQTRESALGEIARHMNRARSLASDSVASGPDPGRQAELKHLFAQVDQLASAATGRSGSAGATSGPGEASGASPAFDPSTVGLDLAGRGLSTREEALETLVAIDRAISDVSFQRSHLGAQSASLAITEESLRSGVERLQAPRSKTPGDGLTTPIAATTRSQVLHQVGVSTLGGRASSSSVLALLRG